MVKPLPAVRAATVEDARRIGEIFALSFRAGFQSLLPEPALAQIAVAERRAVFRDQYRSGDAPEYRSWVAILDGEMVGFADSRPDTSLAHGQQPVGEVQAIYALPQLWGRGIGRTLMRTTLEDLQQRGYGAAILWTLPDNARANGLYRACGWTPDGSARVLEVGDQRLPHVRYRVELDP